MDLFNAYKSVNIFTLHDAGYLLCEEKPLEPVPGTREDVRLEERRRKASIVTFQLMSDAQAGKLKTENIDHKYGCSHFELIETKWTVMRPDLEEWANAKGIKPAFLFPEDASHKAGAIQRKHITKDLEILEEAIQVFWENHDPNRPPKKNEVVEWLTDKGASSERIAESMDTIMRTPEARIGGNKPRTHKGK